MDFFRISLKEARGGVIEISPDYKVGRSKDLMIRGGSFYAIWDDERGLWSTDEYDVVRMVDAEIDKEKEKLKSEGVSCVAKYLNSFDSNRWSQFRKFMKNVSDDATQLDQSLTFANTKTKKSDYASLRLPYALEPGSHKAWDELVGVLYSEEERAKIEWAIGAVTSGDSKKIQKFLVLYGPPGAGKGTVLEIIQKLFVGYTTTFEAKALVGNNNAFSTEVFRSNPLVALQHDGDLSKIEDNSKLNSIISHEDMTMNEKYKPGYTAKVLAFLFMGTNKPVKISDAKSGLIRRLIDVKPSGDRLEANHYHALMAQIDFELGAIAQHCLDTYRKMGKNYYNTYQPRSMMFETDVMFNFIEAHYDIFKDQDGATLKQAWELWKAYAEYSQLEFKIPQFKFREQLKNYFKNFSERTVIDGVQMRSYFSGFTAQAFKATVGDDVTTLSLVMDHTVSLLDDNLRKQPAQYANSKDNPKLYWTDDERLINGIMQRPKPDQIVDTVLSDLDTSKLHFVRVPENHIVIDFDLKGDDGKKSLERNHEAASLWPPTYAEVSKSESGVHLHYIYDGDVSELAHEYSEGIEVKVYTGNSSLRRRLSKCNNVPVATLNSGLPFKENKVLPATLLQSEKGLRKMIERNLNKEFHSGTKSSVDFIAKILEDAYQQGLIYDVTDMRSNILAFANGSSNQPLEALRTVKNMKFKTDEGTKGEPLEIKDKRLVFYDVEVYPNLFIVCWKYEGSPTVVRMINPKPADIELLFHYKLVGFYNRGYDNHILWGAFLGLNNQQLYELSQKLISDDRGAGYGEAWSLSYADVYDFAAEKMTLKKWQIKLGIKHVEMDLPWSEPAPPEYWDKIIEYCVNDVIATEKVKEHQQQAFVARQILADISGLTVNDTTRSHVERILFGNEKRPQSSFIYTDLSKEFPGYAFDKYAKLDKSTYRGEVVGEGGYVYAEPGIYNNVALLDVGSMHPTTIRHLNLFGDEYTPNYVELMEARLAIKHGDFDAARGMLDGRLAPYLKDPKDAKALQESLKLVCNSTYGFTMARFDTRCKDPRNIDNIVAKRGALFMVDLKHAVQELGFTVAHIKTDSIKIPDATPEIIQFVIDFGKKYGYDFEHEATYEKLCLVNDAVYIAWVAEAVQRGETIAAHWSATGAQFKEPYVFKTLFTGEDVTFDDLCQTKSVIGAHIYIDFDAVHKPMHSYEGMHFIGKTGQFLPVSEKAGGGLLVKVKEDAKHSVGGTKGYFWLEASMVKTQIEAAIEAGDSELESGLIDMQYFERMADVAIAAINKFGDYNDFVGAVSSS